MTVRSNQELFALVRELAGTIDNLGGPDTAKPLREALSISTLPGEVIGEVRIPLRHLRSLGVCQRQDVLHRIDQAIAYIGQAFGE